MSLTFSAVKKEDFERKEISMRKRRRSFSKKTSNQSQNRRRHHPRRNNGGGRPAFDPSLLIKQAVSETEKVEYVADHSFNDFPVDGRLKQNVSAKGYNKPTPIQDQAIPLILKGKDVVGIANTGTGKTAAFLIPLINKSIKDRRSRVLIVTPTRELALQVQDEFKKFAKGLQLFSTLCIGGASINPQISNLRKRPHFVIGTPGRLKDLSRRKVLNFANFSTIVLDEVDRMLDMGFIHDVKQIIARLPKERHSLFFSATLTSKVKGVMRSFLNDPVFIVIKTRQAAHNVDQDVIKINGRSKVEVLHDLLNKEEFGKVLVFGRTKRGMDKLEKNLSGRGFNVAAIHGDKSQGQRQKALKRFRNNNVQALLATDVASRGLDIDNVTHVINFDLPETYEDYIHRIGRTGRADKTGAALTFVS